MAIMAKRLGEISNKIMFKGRMKIESVLSLIGFATIVCFIVFTLAFSDNGLVAEKKLYSFITKRHLV